MTILALILLAAGFFFIVSGAIGIVRLPDFYTRLHAMGKCDTLGVALMTLGLALLDGFTLNALKMVLILVFVFLANPTATHALGRAAHRSGLRPWTESRSSSGNEPEAVP